MLSAITNPTRAKQLHDFDGLRYGPKLKIMPSDVDAMLDLKGLGWAIVEVKSGKARMAVGQRIQLERLYHDLALSKPVLLIVARHTRKAHQEVDLASTLVDQIYNGKSWVTLSEEVTVREAIDRFIIENQIDRMLN